MDDVQEAEEEEEEEGLACRRETTRCSQEGFVTRVESESRTTVASMCGDRCLQKSSLPQVLHIPPTLYAPHFLRKPAASLHLWSLQHCTYPSTCTTHLGDARSRLTD